MRRTHAALGFLCALLSLNGSSGLPLVAGDRPASRGPAPRGVRRAAARRSARATSPRMAAVAAPGREPEPESREARDSDADVLSMIYDAHSHAGIETETAGGIPLVRAPSAIMSTEEHNWANTLKAVEGLPEGSVACFGIHPWFAHRAQEGWQDRLRDQLEAVPQSLVGEIGLDKVARTPETRKCEYDIQKEVFEQQLRLAAALKRPVSVHCVRAVGKLHGALEECAREVGLPPAIGMHSYGGSHDWIRRFLALPSEVYFGFSDIVNNRGEKQKEKALENIRAVPDDRLLLESDLIDPADINEVLVDICALTAEAKGWSMEETARRTAENARRFASMVGGGEVEAAGAAGGEGERAPAAAAAGDPS